MNNTRANGSLTVSIVSHGQGELIGHLLHDLKTYPEPTAIVLTHNLPEAPVRIPPDLAARTVVLSNPQPLGFAANHNAAFRLCTTEFFCVVNPDVRLPLNPFPVLLRSMADVRIAASAPAVVNPKGSRESTARAFPTLSGLLLKTIGMSDGGASFEMGGPPLRPDWLAGMFLLLRSDAFDGVRGFDEKFHLYYEDVDLCARLRKAGHELLLCPASSIVHDARRSSRTNPKFMIWHAQSMMRYFAKHIGRLPKYPTVR